MDKQMLRCDICGGTLKMQANREAVCECCGMAYSVERLKEKFNGLKVSVTGSSDDVEQWKMLVNTYLQQHDFIAAERIVKKILEAAPSDEFANNLYLVLQDWKYLEMANGVVIKYHGRTKDINLPNGIKIIGERAFERSTIEKVILPRTVQKIDYLAFHGCESLKSINLSYVDTLGVGCFSYCTSLSSVQLSQNLTTIPNSAFEMTALTEIDIPAGVKKIDAFAFRYCSSIKRYVFHEGLEEIGSDAFYSDTIEKISIPSSVKFIGDRAFSGCCKLYEVKMADTLLRNIYQQYCHNRKNDTEQEASYNTGFGGTPWWTNYLQQKTKEIWRDNDVCQYCGSGFKGLFTKVCSKCGKPKDY